MASIQPPLNRNNDPAIHEFGLWQESARLPGVNGISYEEDDYTPSQKPAFIPRESLKAYLDVNRIAQLLKGIFGNTYEPDQSVVNTIKSKCLVVFAILVSIDMGQHIHTFLNHIHEMGDTKLPHTDPQQRPKHFPDVLTARNMPAFEQFRRYQWQFCTEAFDDSMSVSPHIDGHIILPIKTQELIGGGVSADVYKIELHEGYNNFPARPGSENLTNNANTNVFVLKTFNMKRNLKAKDHFTREVRAFTFFQQDDTREPNLIGFHGAYIHGTSYNIILQYADHGNLNDFFLDPYRTHPADPEERIAFWQKLFELIKALDRIHHWEPQEGAQAGLAVSGSYQGCHHDIKPSNILVTTDPNDTTSKFRFRFLLADLGLSKFAKIQSPDHELETSDPQATRAYGAPECSRIDETRGWKLKVRRQIDVWSLGCIFSEALTWSLLGFAHLHNYRIRRLAQRGGHAECFHDGTNVLSTVVEQHTMLSTVGEGDKITDAIIRDLLKYMLVDPDGRLIVKQVGHRAGGILKASRETVSTGVLSADQKPLTPPPAPPPPHELIGMGITHTNGLLESPIKPQHGHKNSKGKAPSQTARSSMNSPGPPSDDSINLSVNHSPRQLPNLESSPIPRKPVEPPPCITVQQLQDWHEKRKNGEPADLPDLRNLTMLQNRDLVFVVDDSKSMAQHWNTVKNLLRLLGYAIKGYDDDGMELIFMSDRKVHKAKNTKPFVEIVQLHKIRCTTPTNAEDCLARILDAYADRFKQAKTHSPPPSRSHRFSFFPAKDRTDYVKPLSLFVFTDAIWQPQGTCIAANPICRLLENLRGAAERQVGISFIQFGDSELGTKRLRFLDEGLVHRRKVDKDIVDYEPAHDGNVLKMLLGSIHRWWDSANDSEVLDPDMWCED